MELPKLPVRPRAEVVTVGDLLRDALAGRLRVPRFQTGLRWGPRQVEELFDSIVRGFPIGGLLLWKKPAPAEDLLFGPVRVSAPEIADARYIVDGQQRVTALVAGLLHPDPEPLGDRYAVWVDLLTGAFRVLRERAEPTWVPLRLFGERTRLQHWARTAQLGAATDDLVNRAFEIEEALIRYTLPAYIVQDASEEVLRLIFSRTNSAGVPLKEQEVFQALFGNELAARPLEGMATWLDEQTGFGRLPSNWLLRCVKAVGGLDAARSFDEHTPPPPELLQDTREALRRAVGFLQTDAGFIHQTVLPYRFPLLVLARLFHEHRDLHPRNRSLLTRWVWRGALSGVHSNSSHASVRAHLAEIGEDEHDSVQRLLRHAPREVDTVPATTRWYGQAAATRIYASLLIAMEPLDPITEEPWSRGELFRVLTARDLGEIFRPVVPKPPGNPIAARSMLCGRRPEQLRSASEEVLASHAITGAAADALRARDVRRFIDARATLLEERLDLELRRRASAGADRDRPPMSAIVAFGG